MKTDAFSKTPSQLPLQRKYQIERDNTLFCLLFSSHIALRGFYKRILLSYDYKTLIYFGLSALVFSLSVFSTAFASANAGKEVYQRRCSWCHGKSGAGDGSGAAYMNPAPRDLTSGVFKWKSTPHDEPMPTDEDIYNAIAGHNAENGWTGLNGTAMPGWSDVLSDTDMRTLIDYIKELGGLDAPAKGVISLSGKGSMTEADMARAGQLYKDRCSECHGEAGRGDGTKKLKDDWGGRTWPRDLTKPWTFRAGSGVDAIFTRLTVGIAGTQMPSFADTASKKILTESERWAVAQYVAGLAEPDKRPVAGAVVKAVRINTDTPLRPDGPEWSQAQAAAFTLVPQIMEEDRLFTPTNDSINVKALYNDKEISILLEWHDRTMSLPEDEKAQGLAIGEVFPDGVAAQFPSTLPKEGDAAMPPFGMGSGAQDGAVDIWFWQSSSGIDKPQRVRLMQAKGSKEIVELDAGKDGVSAAGVYDKGVWQVVFKRALRPVNGQMQFDGRRFEPFALAAWDGSNAEAGSRHTVTPWLWLSMTEPQDKAIYIWPFAIGVLCLGVIWLVFRGTVRRD